MLNIWRWYRYPHSFLFLLFPLIMMLAVIIYVNQCISQTTVQKDSFSLNYIPVDSSRLRTIPNKAFTAGEKLVYSVDYGFIHAGTALLTVERIDRIHQRNCYYITSWALSSPTFSVFFKVEDKIVSYLDVEGLFSWRSEKHLREGKYKADRVYDLHQLHGVARNVSKSDTIHIPPFVQDALSALYFVRTQPLRVGDTFRIPHFDNGNIYDLGVIVHKKEKIKVPAGTFQTILVEPLMASEGIFKRKGRLKIWMTDDEHRIPVKMTSKIAIGSIGANLARFETDSTMYQGEATK